MKIRFIEHHRFTEQITHLVDDEAYRKFQLCLVRNPNQGPVIPGSGGLRKARLALPGRGKSGGARVIYWYNPDTRMIMLFHCYPKGRCENLTHEQLKRLSELAVLAKKEFQNEKTQGNQI